MIRYRTYKLEEVLPLIGKETKQLGARVNGDRLLTFKKSQTCICCGLKATHFALESNIPKENPHLNLYGIDENGEEVLFTKDHIHPKSKGGKNSLSNLQTMCHPCNNFKSNKIILV